MPWVGLQCVIVVFHDHTYKLTFWRSIMSDSVNCIRLSHRSWRKGENKAKYCQAMLVERGDEAELNLRQKK